ncbi:MAG: site-specific integrase [Terriglobales bacterium]
MESLLFAQADEKGDMVLRKRRPLLRDFKTRFFEWVEGNTTLKQKTKDYYGNGWRLLEGTDVATMRLNVITKDDADRFTFPGDPSNHNNALRTLRRMLGKAEEWNVIKASPKIKLMQEHARERVIDAEIEARLLPLCKQPLRDVLMIMRDSGMRNQKEVFRMRWEHLDWGNKRYFVYESKSPKGRRFVPISPRVRQALLARYSEQKEGWIFPSKRAGEGHLTTVTKQFEKARKEAGLPNDLVLYCARHGFGTEMYRATKNLFAVMNVMGHTSVSTTMKYQHQNIDEVAEVASHRVQ